MSAACSTEGPKDYKIPEEYKLSGIEESIINNETEIQEKSTKEDEEEKAKNYQKLVDLEKDDLIVCTEAFDCPVCLTDYEPNEGILLRECLHVFCRTCIANMIQFSEEPEVKCPFQDNNYTCDSSLLQREIKALLPPEIYEEHLAKSRALAETKIGHTLHCKTPNCKYWCIYEHNDDEEMAKNYQKLLDLEKDDLIVCTEAFDCPVCLTNYEPNEGIVLRECLHVFCRTCITNTIHISEEPEVKCPFRDNNYTCDSSLLQREIKALVRPEIYEEHLAKSIALTETKIGNTFHCKTPDCKYWCIYEDNVNIFDCPVCTHTNCLTCQAIHEGLDCKRFQEQLNTHSGMDVEAKSIEQMLQDDEEMAKNYQKLLDLEKDDLIVCTEAFDCPVCLTDYEPNEGIVLRECLHVFCRTCIINTIQFSEEPEVKCPFRDNNYTCDSSLLQREIKALVRPEIYEEHLAKSIALAETKIGNTFHCKTPDCKGWCIYEENVNIFDCPVCTHTNCLTCQAIHEGLDCKRFQEQLNTHSDMNVEAKKTEQMLQGMVNRGEAMNCPSCQVVLMKMWGCDWLSCSMCKTAICWVTRGPRWGPNGIGDTTGGCRCGVNRIKCHPNCTNCH